MPSDRYQQLTALPPGRFIAKRRADARAVAVRGLIGAIAASAASESAEVVRTAELTAREEAETAKAV